MWESYDGSLTAITAAERYAFEVFERPRVVDRKSIQGEWKGRFYEGTFRLVDGTRTYMLSNDGTRWSVEASPHAA